MRETGIAYDLFSDPDEHHPALAHRPRAADHPGVEEWRGLERALIQRARLFEAILADLYGPQQLLTSGAIPHQLVFSDPSFLRPCHDICGRTGASSSSSPPTSPAGRTGAGA